MANIRQIKLGAFLLGVGHHLSAWRHPDVDPHNTFRISHFQNLAKIAEAAHFDMVFLADNVGMPSGPKTMMARGLNPYFFEPLTVLSAMSSVTQNIGLIATVSTTYLPPFHLARKFASLDHLSGGRVGWNLVTSGTDWEAQNFNLDQQLPHQQRYQYAREYVDVVKGLWDSWEDDAFIFDKEQGLVFDPEKLHAVNHQGQFYKVKGPLVHQRPLQGYPVLVQAGSSDDGQALAAETAEVVFTAQQTLEEAQSFYKGLKSKAEAYGRSPDSLAIMPGVMPFVGQSEAEAQEKFEQLQELLDPVIGLGLLSAFLGHIDFSQYPLDGPVPDFPSTEGWQSRQKLFLDLAKRESLTIRQLYQKVSVARGHRVVIGTAASIADQLEDWFHNEAADGFNILAPTLPYGLEEFSTTVIPELQRRGLFRTSYQENTLRGHLGFAKPGNQFA